MNNRDAIIIHQTLFGDFFITTASNYFSDTINYDEVVCLRQSQYPTYEDCERAIMEMQPKEGIRILKI